MPRVDRFAITAVPPPVAIGTGLLALDVVVTENGDRPPREWLGGSCGNVLSALAFLGWNARPVARLGTGRASGRILEELRKWKQSAKFVTISDDGSTPVIIERIRMDAAGRPRHSFSWRCPSCGRPFPSYKPVLASAIAKITRRIDTVQVFYFDRVSAGAIQLAVECAAKGALVFFEPSGIGNPVQFRQAWKHSHIVKYSHERLDDIAEFEADAGPLLQIETLGEAGLRYRRRQSASGKLWKELPSYPVDDFRDAAGAGDWCSVGILHMLGQAGAAGLRSASPKLIERGIRFGQALAAWNCGYEGARGGMYESNAAEVRNFAKQLMSGSRCRLVTGIRQVATSAAAAVCGACGDDPIARPIRRRV